MDPITAALTVIAILSAGASYVQAKKAQKKAKELTEGVEANVESNSKEIPVVYGKRRVGGVRVYIDTSRDKKHQYLYMVLAMAEGEVDSITDIKIDDVSIEDDRFRYDGPLSDCNLEFEVFLGSDDQEASTLIGDGVSYDYDRLGEIYNDPFADQHERDAADPNRVLPWSSKHKLSGIAYLALKFKWDEGAYTGIPDVTAVVKGRKVYDPRTSTTAWSDNPALCIRDYLTNERFGKGLPASAIDDVAFSQAANDLDSFIAYPYQDSPEYQYLFRMNHVVDTSKKIMENLNDMIIACRGFIPYSNGVYSLKIDQTSSSVLDISPDQIISGIAVAGARKEDRFNQVKVNFFNASLNYKEDQAIYPEQNSTLYQQYLAEDEGEPLVDEIDLYSINNYYSAREMARLFLERSRQNMTIAFQGTSELINLEVGEVVSITHPTPAWTNKLFQVQEVALAFDGTVQITCIEYDAALYTYDTPAEEQPYVGTRLPDPNQVDPPTALSTTTGTYIEADGKAIGYIDLSWSAPEDSLVDRYELKFEYSSREEVIEIASTEYRFKPTQDNVSYVISVRAVNGLGIRSAWLTAAAVTAVVDTTAPSDITGINISAGLQAITLDWTNPTEDDFDLVRIKVADTNEQPATHKFEVRSDSFVHDIGAYSTTKYYWLAPVDRTGNVGNYVSGGTETTGSIAIGDVPAVAGTFYITIANDNEITDDKFLAAIGRNPIEGDVVVLNKDHFFTRGETTWTAVTEFIDGSLLVSDSVTANEINTNTVLTESLLANTANITGDLTVTSGKITVQDTDTIINLDPDAQYPFRISQGAEDVVRLGSSTLDPFIKGAFIRGMPVGSINEADLSTFVRNVVGVTSEEKTETETLTRLETGGNLTYLETDTITIGLTTVLTLESVAGTQSWLYEYADAGDWENGDFALFNYTLQGYNGSDWEDVPLWVNRPIFASGYRISGALIGWSISESYSVTIEDNTFTHFRMVVGNMPEEFGGGLHATSTGINCDFKLTSVTGSQVNSDNYVNSFSINDTSGVITVGRTGSLGNLTADISTYVSNQVSALVDSAPSTLDTLNELAAALGDDENFSVTMTNALADKADLAGAAFTGDVEIVGDGDTFTLRSTDDITGHVGIQFTSQGESATQFGHIRYSHLNGSSYGNLESFTIGGTEASTAILADGNFLYRDGIYKKPATGTGAGIRKDTNWDTAYGWGDHSTQGYLTSVPAEYLTQTEGDARYHALSGSDLYKSATYPTNTFIKQSTETAYTGLTVASVGGVGVILDTNNNDVSDFIVSHGSTDIDTATKLFDINGAGQGATIYLDAETSRAPVGLTLHSTVADIDGAGYADGNFIDFKITDSNATFTPQARIGMLVKDYSGDGGIPSEGTGNFTISVGQGTDTSGNGTLKEALVIREDNLIATGVSYSFTAYGNILSSYGNITASNGYVKSGSGGFYVSDNQVIDSARNASFVGGTFSGTVVVGSDSTRKPIQVKSETYAEVQFFTNGTEYTRIGTAEGGSLGAVEGDFYAYGVGRNKMHLIVPKDGSALKRENGTITIWDSSHFANNSSNWNTAYTYSQVGHLPLSGGTLTGNLTLNSATPEILFNGTSDAGVDMAIKATPEGLDFYEPEDVNKIHFQILDDTGVNAPFGYSVGATQVIDSSGNVKKSPTLTLSGDVSGTATFTDLGNATLTATVANDSHTHDGRYYTESESNSRFVNVTGDTMSGQLTIGSGGANPLILTRSTQVGIEFNDTSTGQRYLGVNSGVLRFGDSLDHSTNDRVFTDAYHPNADKWTTAKTLSLTGDVTGSVSWDGSANASITTVVGNDSHNHTHSDGAFTVNGSLTTTGNIIMPNDNYVNRTFTMIDNAATQYILLCANAGSNDVNATIRIDRTSGNYQAVILDVIVTSGSATMFGGTLRTLQVIQNSEDYRLVSVTYGGNNWIAIKYTGNAYPMTFPCTVTGRIKSTLPSELTVVSSGITNEASFGGNSESYQEVDNFVVSGDTTSSNGLFNGQLIVDGGTGVSSSGTLHLRQKGDTVNDGMAITSSNGTAHRIWKDASGVLNFGIGSIPNQFGMDTSGNFKVNGTTVIDSARNFNNVKSLAVNGTKPSSAQAHISSTVQYALELRHAINSTAGDYYDTISLLNDTNVANNYTQIGFRTRDVDGQHHRASIQAHRDGASYAGMLRFKTRSTSSSLIDSLTIDSGGDVDVSRGSLQVGGTNVIDSNKNGIFQGLTAGGGSNTVRLFSNTSDSRVIKLRDRSNNLGNIIQFEEYNGGNVWEVVGRKEGTYPFYIYKNWGNGSGYKLTIDQNGHGKWYSGDFDVRTGNLRVGNVTNSVNGYQVNGTTVIDSSRNLTNIGTISTSGSITVGSGTTSSYIRMEDSDNGGRYIHCNSNRVGFLTSSNGWGSWCNDDGSWVSGSYISGSELKVSGTTVIDSSRNLTNIGTGSFSGNVVLNGSGNSARLTVGGSRIISVSGSSDVVWQNLGQLRISDRANYDWDDWFGIKYDSANQTLYMGGSNSSVFSNNSGKSATINFDGVTNIQHNGTTVIDSSRNLVSINAITATGSGMGLFSTNMSSNDDWQNSPISIRERGMVSSAQSADTYAPNLNFHWAGRASNSLWMNSSGHLVYGSYSSTGTPNADGSFASGDVRTNIVYDLADTSTYLEMRGDGGGVRVKTSNGYIDFGAQNSSWAHIITDRSGFYFNTGVTVDSGIVQSYNEDLVLRRAGSSSHQMTLNTSGATFTGNVTAYSDITLKDNITNIDNALDKVNSIRGVTYDRIDQDNVRHAGVIAQEVEAVLPEVVHTDDNGIKSVAYGNMVGLLIEAIKEQQVQIDELKSKLEK